MYNITLFKYLKNKFYFRGLLINLYKLPNFVVFSNIIINNKITYSKSSGTFCKIKKSKKSKKKLILIILPSKTEIFLSKFVKVYIGKNKNFKVNELVEGKFGYSLHVKKNINVRGVAMNPVDHPNGGRTKTPQPERSPWNWIAKHKK